MNERERLFRDDGGAAVERAARLQEENVQLRQQLVYERSQRQATTVRKSRGPGAGALFAVVALFLIGIGAGVSALLFVRAPAAPPTIVIQQTAMPAVDQSQLFDRAAAATALGAVELQTCKRSEGPTGSGHVKVTFANDGSVAAVVLDSGPFAGTLEGSCIEDRFRVVRVPAFGGAPVTVGKSFTMN